MNKIRLSALILAASLPFLGAAQTSDPDAILKSFDALRSAAFAKAKEESKPFDSAATERELSEKAREAIAGIDVAKVAGQDAYAWSKLFRLAGKKDESIALAEKAAHFNGMVAWQAQSELLQSYLELDQYDKVLRTLDFMSFADTTMLGQAGEWVAFALAPKVQETNPQLALDAFDLLLRRVDLKRPMDANDKGWANFAVARINGHRAKVLYKMGRQDEAVRILKGLQTRFSADKRASEDIRQNLNQLSTSNKPAPEIAFDRQIGGFTGLSKLKGKVVILDFFAHWCGPCIRAFPMVRELYTDLKPKGLEVVGITSYYGYYGAQQGLDKAQEFEKMKSFVKEKEMTWPVAFTDGSANEAYGVSAIPHMVVVDRKGVVRFVEVGFNPAEKGKLRSTIEKLLAE
jgi:thiol-disulfide isomerase/thioredoxin